MFFNHKMDISIARKKTETQISQSKSVQGKLQIIYIVSEIPSKKKNKNEVKNN